MRVSGSEAHTSTDVLWHLGAGCRAARGRMTSRCGSWMRAVLASRVPRAQARMMVASWASDKASGKLLLDTEASEFKIRASGVDSIPSLEPRRHPPRAAGLLFVNQSSTIHWTRARASV
jgi:hypothetical protein